MKIMITGHRPPRLKGQEQKVREWVAAVVAELAKKEKIDMNKISFEDFFEKISTISTFPPQ